MKTSLAVAFNLLAALALCATPGLTQAPSPPSAKADAKGEVLATVGGQPVTRGDVETLAGARLVELRNQEYNILRQALDEKVNRIILEGEAARRKITVEELIRQEIESKTAPVTAEDQKAFYEQNKAQFGSMAEAEALKNADAQLRQQRLRTRGLEYLGGLRTALGVKVLLDAPRYAVSASPDDPSRGPANAPVTIVEFSDFQCPFCSRVVPTLKRIEEQYGPKVRIVFRDLPLTQIHKNAAKAAEAGACAHEQGKFWELHDKLYANQAALSVDDLKKTAASLGIEPQAFNTCLDSGRHTAEWKEDAAEAASFGIGGTPAFLVNGRLLTGAQPYENFARVIDEELDRGGRAPVAPAPAVQ
jgi:protein-disulfide isomerase